MSHPKTNLYESIWHQKLKTAERTPPNRIRETVQELTTPNIRFIDFINPLILRGVFPKTSQDCGSYDGGHLHYFTFRDIKKLLTKVGFSVVRERGYDQKKYFSAKVAAFKLMMKLWEKEINKEFFCQGILVTATKI
jgi:hypothetical protein